MPKNPARLAASALIAITLGVRLNARADDSLYRYEGDVPPYDEAAGWAIFNECTNGECTDRVENGHFVIEWATGDLVNYDRLIARMSEQPPTLWVEWGFRSNQRFGGVFDSCDGRFAVRYQHMYESVRMFGDSAFSFDSGGNGWILGLGVEDFHTYRLESVDGMDFRVSVDGTVFWARRSMQTDGGSYAQFGGWGGCGDLRPTIDEWDFVRYGTISYGEKIVAAEPPAGFLRPEDFPALDGFTVRFDQPNYVYVDEIGIESFDADGNRQEATGNEAEGIMGSRDQGIENRELQIGNWNSAIGNPPPQVVATRRLDNGPPDVVEIVLDKPIPLDARTVFTFDDGTIRQTVAYTYIQGDANADGRFDLHDAAELQNCFLDETVTGHCWAFDFDASGYITLEDYAAFHPLATGP